MSAQAVPGLGFKTRNPKKSCAKKLIAMSWNCGIDRRGGAWKQIQFLKTL